MEKRYIRKDGNTIWVRASASLRRDTAGRPIHIIGLIEDINARKQAEEALRESEQKFRALFENSPDAVFLSTPDGSIAAANPAACAMFGWSEQELCNLGCSGIIDVEEAAFW